MPDCHSIYESGSYLEQNPDWHAEDAPYKAKWVAEILQRNALDPKHVVEIGCGSGQILVDLAQKFPRTRFDGYDISSQALAIASSKARHGLAFHQADYLAMQTDTPDLLMAIDVFEHVEDYMGFIRSMKPRAHWKLFHIPSIFRSKDCCGASRSWSRAAWLVTCTISSRTLRWRR